MRLRQVALVARALEPVVDDLSAVLGLTVVFRDPSVEIFGLENAVMAVGDTFLEVVSPTCESTAAGRLLERRRGDGGYMVILQTDDLAADRARLASLGVRVVFETALEDIACAHLHPRDVGGAILSLDQPRPPASWRWAGPTWASARPSVVSRAIVGAELQAADPAAMARRWAEVLGRTARRCPADTRGGAGATSGGNAGKVPADARADETHEIALEGGTLRFVPARDGRGEGLAAIHMRVADAERVRQTARARSLAVDDGEITICGTRIVLRHLQQLR
jgi:hypothetical protein